jgi:hypothetical protein
MPELEKNTSARRMDGLRRLFPPFDLGTGINTGLTDEGRISLHDHRRLGNDKPGSGALRVILRYKITGT